MDGMYSLIIVETSFDFKELKQLYSRRLQWFLHVETMKRKLAKSPGITTEMVYSGET